MYVEVVDYYLTRYHLMMIGIVEVVCIGWCYSTERLATEVWLATGEAAPKAWRGMVCVGCPMVLISLLLSTIIQDLGGSGIKYSSGMSILGWLVFAAGSSWIVIGAVWPISWGMSSTPIAELAALTDERSSETITGVSEQNAAVRTVSASLVELVVERAGSGIAALRHSLSGHQLLQESPENSPDTTPRRFASTAFPRPASTPPGAHAGRHKCGLPGPMFIRFGIIFCVYWQILEANTIPLIGSTGNPLHPINGAHATWKFMALVSGLHFA